MVKAILFDFWGTLVEHGVWSPTKQIRNILQIRVPFSDYVVRMERAMMTEKFPSLKDCFVSVCEEFAIPADDSLLNELVGMWNKNWMLARPYLEVQEVLEKLKDDYKLVLFANTDCFSINNIIEKFGLEKYFEKIYFSYDLHLIKTDKNFLRSIVDDLGFDVEDCLVVGDSMQSDMMSATKSGLPSVLVDRRKKRDYEKKVSDLKELKSFLE